MNQFVLKIIFAFVRLWSSTFRYEYYNQAARNKAIKSHPKGTYAYGAWHEHLLSGMMGHVGVPHLLLISASKDGDIAAYACKQIGSQSARGSSRKGGKQALEEMIERMRDTGIPAAFTVDGPKGPRRVVKKGVVTAAKETNSKVIPISIVAEHYIEFNSWDRFKLPLPFSRVILYFGQGIDCSSESEEVLTLKVKEALEEGENYIRRNYLLHQL
jgi:lysophospholipid acyltransferase (LPLAT)-like uncharacterized protein